VASSRIARQRQFHCGPSGTFRTKDGYINIAANQQAQWEDLADTLGLPELKTDPRFLERDTRKANRKLLTPLLEVKLVEQTTAYWVDALNEKDVPSGAILSLEAALSADQVKHRQVIGTVNEPEIGDIQLFNLTAKFSKTPGRIDSPPPRLSAHTAEILAELGYSAEDLEVLKDKTAI
jgi:crotonobetainyl-CoA:carnitine CoA-transferase CaiB-like acyl-CoA transferase